MTEHDVEPELRAAVRAYGEGVQPRERLDAIRTRTSGRTASPPWVRPWVLAAGAALAATAVVVGAITLTGSDPSGSTEPPVASGDTYEVTVYEIGGVGKEVGLYPVQVTTEDSGDPAADAVRALLAHEPTGNHFTLWSDLCTHGNGVRLNADVGDANCNLDPSGYEAQQQLAWTVRDAMGSTDVEVVIDGAVLRPVAADPAALSPIIVEAPADGETVSSPVRITGTSDTFEANVQWQVLQDGAVADEGFTMGGTMGERAPFRFTVDLPAGDYTVRAFATSAEDGSLFAEDTVAFSVR